MRKKIILFILSSGHSGSTILDLALGAHQDCFSLGEVSGLQYSININAPCVCGESFSKCKFWLGVKEHLNHNRGILLKPESEFFLKPDQQNKLFVNRLKTALQISGFIHRRTEWLDNAQHLYDSIFSVSNALVLIDSSKNLRRALLMKNELSSYDFKFLHLVRDVRGVACSYNKKNFIVQLPGEQKKIVQRTKDIFTVEKTCKNWNQYNRKISLTLKALIPNKDVKRIRYEDLCSDPDTILKGVIRWMDLEYTGSLKVFATSKHHNIGGNPSRFNSTEIKPVDEKWRTDLTNDDIAICMKQAGFLNRYYGYT